MKMKPADYETMKVTLDNYIAKTGLVVLSNYKAALVSDKRVHDLNKRFRWDVLHASRFDICALYSYMHDDHIDTALRHYMDKKGL